MEIIETAVYKFINSFRPDCQVLKIRGRWCSINKVCSTVYKVSVIDLLGNYVGARFITPGFWFGREVDRAVHSLLVTQATY